MKLVIHRIIAIVRYKLVDTDCGEYARYFLIIGIVTQVSTYIYTTIFLVQSEQLSGRIRHHFLCSLFKQNTSYFEKLGPDEVTNRILNDSILVQVGISDKLGDLICSVAALITATGVAFKLSWQMSLLVLSPLTAAFIITRFGSFTMKKVASNVKQEASTAVRMCHEYLEKAATWAKLNSERAISRKMYLKFERVMRKKFVQCRVWGFINGCVISLLYFVPAFTLWQGAYLVYDNKLNVSSLIGSVSAGVMVTVELSMIQSLISVMKKSIQSGRKMFEVIDRDEGGGFIIDHENGEIPDSIEGMIVFKDVKTVYPNRGFYRNPIVALNGFSLTVEKGETVVLVGKSGSGKSAVFDLLLRHCLAVRGYVHIDDYNLYDLGKYSLRQFVSHVPQESQIFSGTILDNVIFGLTGTKYEHLHEDAQLNMVKRACKEAGAWGFILALKDQLLTQVGERGCLLSATQKRRLEIARAIVSKPKILLLDEPTSLLDYKMQAFIQSSIASVSKNMTVMMITHNLSTIRKLSDKIVVMENGSVVELGKHDELMQKDGVYADFIKKQRIECKQGSAVAYDTYNRDSFAAASYIQKQSSSINDWETSILASRGRNTKSNHNKLTPWSIASLIGMLVRVNKKAIGICLLGLVVQWCVALDFQ